MNEASRNWKKIAVIVAGGKGERMQGTLPKQFILIHDRPVLYYTIRSFLEAYPDMQVIVVLPEAHLATGKSTVSTYFSDAFVQFTEGGATRFHSVKNGLQLIREDAVIFVHDGVRCLTDTELIQRCYEEALVKGSAVPVIECRDSVRMTTPEGNSSVDRAALKLVQTPQTFLSTILLPAYQQEYRTGFTDEATVVEAAGHQIHLTEGSAENIKLTLPIDLIIAAELLQKKSNRMDT